MAVKAIEWALRQNVQPTGAKLVLVALADALNANDTSAWPSRARIAQQASCGERQVRRHIATLVEIGLIEVIAGKGQGRGKGREASHYVLACDPRTGLPRPLTGGHSKPRVKAITGGHQQPPVTLTGGHASHLQEDMRDIDTIYRTGIEPESLVCPKLDEAPKAGTDLFGEPDPTPVKKPTKKAKKVAAYTPEFEDLWKSWPKARRELSDKRKAFERYSKAMETWGADTVRRAADHYLAKPEVRKEGFRYCRLVEVFLNGGLEAQIESLEPNEAPATINGRKPRVWSNLYHDWVDD
jgi:hypothetical protein